MNSVALAVTVLGFWGPAGAAEAPPVAGLAAAATSGTAGDAPSAARPREGSARARGPVHLIARIDRSLIARSAPRTTAPGRLRLLGFAPWSRATQGLLVTGRHRDARGVGWVRVLLPMRPNGTEGWLRASQVRLRGTRRRVVVRLDTRRLELWSDRRRVASFPTGVGRPGTPTPTGRFAVQDPLRTPAHLRGVYGTWTLILSGHSTAIEQLSGANALIGIHGPGGDRRWRVGQLSSLGCAILSEPALARVAAFVEVGTPVTIRGS